MLSDDELPPLPNKEKLHTVLPDDYRYGHIYGYTADQMRDYARAALQARIEADEALMRQALRALVWEVGSEQSIWANTTRKTIAALRERLGEKP